MYSYEEYEDLIFVYGYCNGSTTASVRDDTHTPNHRLPSNKQTFRFSTTFTIHRLTSAFPKRTGCERNNPEEVFDFVENNLGTSARRISVLSGQTGYIPIITNRYKIFSARIFPKAFVFVTGRAFIWILFSRTLFCDEDRINNRKPSCCPRNPFPDRPSVNVWAGVI